MANPGIIIPGKAKRDAELAANRARTDKIAEELKKNKNPVVITKQNEYYYVRDQQGKITVYKNPNYDSQQQQQAAVDEQAQQKAQQQASVDAVYSAGQQGSLGPVRKREAGPTSNLSNPPIRSPDVPKSYPSFDTTKRISAAPKMGLGQRAENVVRNIYDQQVVPRAANTYEGAKRTLGPEGLNVNADVLTAVTAGTLPVFGAAGSAGRAATGTVTNKLLSYGPEFLYKTPFVADASRFVIGAGLSLGGGYAASEVPKRSTEQVVGISNNDVNVGLQAQTKNVGGGIANNIKYGISIGLAPESAKKAGRTAVYDAAINRGLSPDQARAEVDKYEKVRKSTIIGEVGGNLLANTASEELGQGLVVGGLKSTSKKFAEGSTKRFFQSAIYTGLRIAPAGAVEGATVTVVQNVARGNQLSQGVLTNSLIGSGTAGVLGGTVVGFSAVGTPRATGISKGMQIALYATDPYEYPGDLSQRLVTKANSKFFGTPVFTPTITATKTADNGKTKVSNFVMTNTIESSPQSNKRWAGFNVDTYLNTFGKKAPVNTNSNVRVNPFSNVLVNNDIPLPTNVITPVNTKTDVPVFPNINTNENTYINTNTNINTNVNIPVNTIVPLGRLFPPVPLMVPFDLNYGAGGKGRKGVKYVNELALGNNLMLELQGNGVFGNGGKPLKRSMVFSNGKKKRR
jgi:hypothetical protein